MVGGFIPALFASGSLPGAVIPELPLVAGVVAPDPDGVAPVPADVLGPVAPGPVAVCSAVLDVPFWSCEPLPPVLPGASTGVTALEPFGPRPDGLLVTGFAEPFVLVPVFW